MLPLTPSASTWNRIFNNEGRTHRCAHFLPKRDKIQFVGLLERAVGNAVLSVPTAKRHIFERMYHHNDKNARFRGHQTPKIVSER